MSDEIIDTIGAEAPAKEPSKASYQTLGTTGLNIVGGYVSDEFLRELQGSRAAYAFREIADNSPVASGIILGYQNVATHLDWRIEEDPEAEGKGTAEFEFIQSAFADLDEDWDSILSQILSKIVFGWSMHEIVYKKRDGKASIHKDGKVGWKDFPIRAQESLERWIVGEHGEIMGMVQRDPMTGRRITIPMWKSLLFRTTEMKNNPEGRSLLRSAYIPYQYVRRIQEYEAIGVERDLAGLPVAWVPDEWLSSNDPTYQAAVAKITKMVQDVRRNEREGLVLPMIYEQDLTGAMTHNKRLDFELLSSAGGRQFDTDKIIQRYNQQIGMSMLADFITLGHDGVGSFALGTAKIDLWIMVVDSLCKSVAQTFNKFAIKKLLELNGMSTEYAPRLVYGDVENVDLAVIGTFIKTISDAGLLTPDEGTERWLREKASLPPVEVEGPPPAAEQLEREAEMAEAMKEQMAMNAQAAQDGEPAGAKPAAKAPAKKDPTTTANQGAAGAQGK